MNWRDARHISYRGSLKSCNYQCGYCPFAKRKASARELAADRKALLRFVRRMEEEKFAGSLLFLPYGEAMIHPQYWEAMARLSRAPAAAVSCQTNLSFSVGDFAREMKGNRGRLEKIRLWCSFHPEMTTPERFADACRSLLENKIVFCAGCVGDPRRVTEIRRLRRLLPPEIYVWINRMDGLNRPYTADEAAEFLAVDPMFSLELRRHKADPARCAAGKSSLFVRADGEIFPCNIAKISQGNLYGGALRPPSCRSRACDCYLAYAQREDLAATDRFLPHKLFRIPRPRVDPAEQTKPDQ